MPQQPETTRTTLRNVVEQAAQAWDQLQLMYARQDAERKRTQECGSWPRDAFESWVDDLVQNAKEALNAQP